MSLRESFLQGMSHAACTVNVVTTDGVAGRAGVTVSAMASVSADTPAPSLLVCVHHQSSAADAIIENRVFCVNVLRDDQAHISDVFARRLATDDGDKFSCAQWTAQYTGAPRVVDPLVAFDCQLTSHMQVGTHHVFFGEVMDIFVAGGGQPLVYANRAYGTMMPLEPEGEAAGLEPADGEGLAVGCFRTFGPYVVPALLARLTKRTRGLPLRLVEGDQQRMSEALVAGEIDLALMYGVGLDERFDAETLTELNPYVLLAQGHPLAEWPSLSLDELTTQPLVLLDVPPSRDFFLSLFTRRGLTPKIGYETTSFEMARGLVGHGLGYSLLTTKPANNMTYDGRALVSRVIEGDVAPSRLVLARRAGSELSPLAEAFAEGCRRLFSDWTPG